MGFYGFGRSYVGLFQSCGSRGRGFDAVCKSFYWDGLYRKHLSGCTSAFWHGSTKPGQRPSGVGQNRRLLLSGQYHCRI